MNDGQSRISIELLVLLIIQLGSCVVVGVFLTEVQTHPRIAPNRERDVCLFFFFFIFCLCFIYVVDTEVQRQAGIAQICLRDLCMILFLLQMVRC
jgi:hypothetical protein